MAKGSPDWTNAVRLIAVDAAGNEYPVTVTAEGRLECIIVGEGENTLAALTVEDGRLICVIQDADSGQPVAIDGGGRMQVRLVAMDNLDTAHDVAVNNEGHLIMSLVAAGEVGLVVDGDGHLTCKLSGALSSITDMVKVDQDAKDRKIQGETTAGPLKTVALDNDGQVIMVPRGKSGYYMAVDANGYLGAILKAGVNIDGSIPSSDLLTFRVSYDLDADDIYSLVVYNGKLYAASYPGGKIFVYNGADWTVSYDSDEDYIFSLAVYNGKLYAGSGGAGKVFVYDGEDWTESYDSDQIQIRSLAVYNGKLYAGSAADGKIFVYDDADWTVSYDLDKTHIYALAVYNGKLYAGSRPGGKVLVYDGADWTESYDSDEDYILSLEVYNGKLYAGSGTGGKVFVYDGTDWTVSYDSDETHIYSLVGYNGKLYAGSSPGGKVFVYDGIDWSVSYDSDEDYILSLGVYNGKLYVGSSTGGKVFVARGSSLSDLAVDGEGFLTTIMKGNDSGTLRTLAVDVAGRMEALMKGLYGEAYKTIATDSEGRMLTTIRNMPYEDTILYHNSCNILLGASGFLQTQVVGAGKIWVVTNVCTYADTSYFSRILLSIMRGGGVYRVKWGADTNGGVNSILHDQPLYLKAGDLIRVDFDTAVATTDCYIHLNGYILPAYS